MSASASEKDTNSPLNGEVETLIEELMKDHHVTGLSVAVIDDGKVYTDGYGYATLPSTRATPDTLYYACSTTKAFVGAAAGILIENETEQNGQKLKWYTPLKSVLKDDFVLHDEWATNNITIEDALSHRSGLPRHDLCYGWTGPDQLSMVKTMRHLPFTESPRTVFQYCNIMYAAVGALLEKFTSKSMTQVLTDLLWKPLGMNATFFDIKSAAKQASEHPENNLARGYFWLSSKQNPVKDQDSNNSEGGKYIVEPYYNISPISAAGYNISTVKDYAKWVKALLEAAAESPSPNTHYDAKPVPDPPKDQIITPKLFTGLVTPRVMMTKPEPFPNTPDLNPYVNPDLYALGWLVAPRMFPGELVVHHSGGLPGFGAQVFMLPSHNFGVVTFGNTSLTANLVGELVCVDLMARKLGLDKEKREAVVAARKRFWLKLLKSSGWPVTMDEEERDQKSAAEKKAAEDKKKAEEKKKGKTKHDYINDILGQNLPLPSGIKPSDLEGEYHHPAYGPYTVKVIDEKTFKDFNILLPLEPPKDSEADSATAPGEAASASAIPDLQPVDSNPSNPTDTTTQENKLRLHLIPKGERAIYSSILLTHSSGQFFHFEILRPHGNVADEPAGLSDTQKLAEMQPVTREATDKTEGGGIFAVEDGKVKKMGLVMVGEMDETVVREGKSWEDARIWFDRV